MAARKTIETKSFSMGTHTLSVPLELFALNRRRLCERLCPRAPKAVVLLQGGTNVPLYDTDVNYLFQQESFFHWTFGVNEPDFYGALDVATGHSYLFAPQFHETHAPFLDQLPTCQDLKDKYAVDVVGYVNNMKCALKKLKPEVLLVLSGINWVSGRLLEEAFFEGIAEFNVDKDILHTVMMDCRVFKTDLELEVLRYVNKISSEAHRLVMSKVLPGMLEYQAETMFLHYCYFAGGCRCCAYTPVCCSGPSGAVLHYGHAGRPNNRVIVDGDMLLLDMGTRYCGYCADISCSFPVNGIFTELQAAVYDAVLKARAAVLAVVGPGTNLQELNRLANKRMLASMKKSGILTGQVEDMMKAKLAKVFQPHGLGHQLGKDVHDVGEYLEQEPVGVALPWGRYRPTARTLEAGMVVAVEPGCYFVDRLLNTALAAPEHSPFLVPDMIARLRGLGGVRVEDNIVITDSGYEMLTDVPRTIQEIEDFMDQNNKGCNDGKHSSSTLSK